MEWGWKHGTLDTFPPGNMFMQFIKSIHTALHKGSLCVGNGLLQFAHTPLLKQPSAEEGDTHQFWLLSSFRHWGTASGLHAYNCVPKLYLPVQVCLSKAPEQRCWPSCGGLFPVVSCHLELRNATFQGTAGEANDGCCGHMVGNSRLASRPSISQYHQVTND